MAVFMFSTTPSLNRFQFEAGNQLSWTAKSQMRKMPKMKFGIERATWTAAELAESCHFDCLYAPITPMGIATSTERKIDMNASWKVTGRRWLIVSRTG